MRLEHPIAEKLQQGAIFNCALVPGYQDCKCYGIVLTARCDLEHRKYSVVNYLPIVPFSAWAQRSLCNILARRISNELENEIGGQLTKKGISQSVRATFPIKDVIEKETTGREQTALLAKCSQLETVARVSSLEAGFCSEARTVIQMAGKKSDKLVEELIQQKLGEYYFLEGVDLYSPPGEGFVVLLRQMRTIETGVVARIIQGITMEDAQSPSGTEFQLTFIHEPLCLITGVLRSPDIEHLAQHFANLFVRIGLEDHDATTFEKHLSITNTL